MDQEISPLLKASLDYDSVHGVGMIVFCDKCLKEAGYDDMTDTGNWCSDCQNQHHFTSIPSDFAKSWDDLVSEGNGIDEIKKKLLILIEIFLPTKGKGRKES